MLSGGMYLYFMAYAAAPYIGWDLSSATVGVALAGWPMAAKVLLKVTVAFPFVFHSFNGLRHLYMDIGGGFASRRFIHTGWAVFGLSALGTLYLTFIA
jgi:succinate dehydrogenase (ubiquinone) cytochrome b560 subunit